MFEFKLPEVGENIESGTVVTIMVKTGDTVKKDQDLIEIETDKASLPVPSPVDGVIKDVLVNTGDEVKIGQTLMKIEAGDEAPAPQAKTESPPAKEQPAATQPQTKPAAPATPPPVAQPHRPQGQITPPTFDPSKDTQLVVIGGGPGGYAAAFLAADLGLKTTIVDLEPNPGGVCVYRGCIPSKALLHVAKLLAETKDAKELGVDFGDPKINLDNVRGWKDKVVKQLTGGTGQLTKARKIKWIQGRAEFTSSQSIHIKKTDGGEEDLTYDYAILATGSVPVSLPFAPTSERIMDSTGALDLPDIPKKFLVIGGGYIGLELGTVYHELGSEVSVVEMLPHLLMGADRDLAMILEKRLKTRFKNIMLETKVTAIEESGKSVKVSFEDKAGKKSTEEYDRVLVAIGRKPNTQSLGLEKTKVKLTDRKFVEVDAQLRTTDPHIFAIGDIAGDPMLAHKASHEGRVAVEAIMGHKVAFEPNAIPAVVFTDPEIAWCGITEAEANQRGVAVKVEKFPWAASGRAVTLNRTDGMTKLMIDPDTERILGVAICGVGAGEMISEGVIAVEMGSVAADLKLSIHPHPTLSETMMETAEGFFGHSTHIYRPKKK